MEFFFVFFNRILYSFLDCVTVLSSTYVQTTNVVLMHILAVVKTIFRLFEVLLKCFFGSVEHIFAQFTSLLYLYTYQYSVNRMYSLFIVFNRLRENMFFYRKYKFMDLYAYTINRYFSIFPEKRKLISYTYINI